MMMFRFLIYQENLSFCGLDDVWKSTPWAWLQHQPSLEKTWRNWGFWAKTRHFMSVFMICSWNVHMKCSCQLYLCPPLLPWFNRFACSKGRTCWHAANRISFNDASMEHGVSCKIGCQCSQVECTGTQLKWEDLEKSWVCLQTGYPRHKFHGLSSYQCHFPHHNHHQIP